MRKRILLALGIASVAAATLAGVASAATAPASGDRHQSGAVANT